MATQDRTPLSGRRVSIDDSERRSPREEAYRRVADGFSSALTVEGLDPRDRAQLCRCLRLSLTVASAEPLTLVEGGRS